MRIRHQLALSIFLVGCAALAAICVLFYAVSRDTILSVARQELLSASEEKAEGVSLFLRERAKRVLTITCNPVVVQALAASNDEQDSRPEHERRRRIAQVNDRWMATQSDTDPFVRTYLQSPAARELAKYIRQIPDEYGEIFVTDRAGLVVGTTQKLTTIAHAHKYWWQAAYDAGKGRIFFDDRGYDESVGGYVLGVVVPVMDDARVIGILKCNLKVVSTLGSIVGMSLEQDGVGCMLVRSGGRVIYRRGKEPLASVVPDRLRSEMQRARAGSAIATEDGGEKLFVYASVGLSDSVQTYGFGGTEKSVDHRQGNRGERWSVVTVESLEQIFAPASSAATTVLTAGIVLTALMAVAAWLLGDRFARPIADLAAHAARVGKGDFRSETAVLPAGELGLLARTLDEMAMDLRRTTVSRDALLREITERERTEQERARLEAQLRQEQRLNSIGTLAAGMAHEINNPINGIMGYAQLIQDGLESGDGELGEYAAGIICETNRVTTLIRDLLRFAEPRKQGRRPARMCDIVTAACSLVLPALRTDQIAVDVHVPEQLPKIRCRSRQIQQVLTDLLMNARDALNQKYPGHDDGKRITISATLIAKDDQPWLRTTIEDCGIGIAPELLPSIFDPFVTSKDRAVYTGLGLSVSHGIVRDHDGQLTVESRKGVFTRLHLDLPVESGT